MKHEPLEHEFIGSLYVLTYVKTESDNIIWNFFNNNIYIDEILDSIYTVF